MRVEPEYNTTTWLKAIVAFVVGLSLGDVVEGSLLEIVWFVGQKGRPEL